MDFFRPRRSLSGAARMVPTKHPIDNNQTINPSPTFTLMSCTYPFFIVPNGQVVVEK
jgi:hypothetical protein